MRTSVFYGLLTLVLGVVLSYFADALVDLKTIGMLQSTATTVAAVLFIIFSATLLGFGAGLVVHWILGFGKHWQAFIAEVILSFATFFIGVGATLMSGNWMTALQIFFTFFVASTTLFSLSFINFFGGITEGIVAARKYAKKTFKW